MTEITPLTGFGRRIVNACPSSRSLGIDERSLIEKVHGLSAYADYQHMIQELIDMGYLVRDPATQKIKRSSRRVEQKVRLLTIEQVKQLLSAADEHPLKALVTIAIITGLRWGELIGLRWQDIDLENKLLHVRRMVSWMGEREATETVRTIALPKIALNTFKEQQEVRVQSGKAWYDFGLVFPNEGGQCLDPRNLRQQFTALIATAGLPPIRFHDLRHTTAALLFTMGANRHVVQTILGYRWTSTALKASIPVSLTMQREAMQKWDDLLLEQ